MHPFNIITLDLITQLPKANGHNAILTIVDQGCSRAAAFIPCNMRITGEGVVLLYLKYLSLGLKSHPKSSQIETTTSPCTLCKP